jgi:hypothetical protein
VLQSRVQEISLISPRLDFQGLAANLTARQFRALSRYTRGTRVSVDGCYGARNL